MVGLAHGLASTQAHHRVLGLEVAAQVDAREVVDVALALEVLAAVLVLHVQHEMDLVLDQVEVAVDADSAARQ